MDVKQVVSDMISLGGLGGLATLIGTIWAIIHEHKKDERQDDEDRRKLDDWLIQKVKETSDGKPQMLCVDDPDAEVTYDPHTQVLKQLDQAVQVAAKIGGAQAQLKVTVDEANKAMAKIGGRLAQLQVAAKSTDAAATN